MEHKSAGLPTSTAEDAPALPPCTFKFAHATFDIGSRYQLEKEVGFGTYGLVCSGMDTVTKRRIAVKKIGRIFDREVLTRRTLREIRLLRHFAGHSNIIELRDVLMPHCALEKGERLGPRGIPKFEDVYIVQDLMDTDLQRLISSNQPLTTEHVRYFVYQLMRGLKYMHSAGVLHRDLKPGNCLLNGNCDLKICDLGMARGIASTPEQQNGFMTAYVATRWYRAPEIMLSSGEYTHAVDMWSAGCIFAELLARRPLFPGRDYVHQLNLIIAVLGTPPDAFVDAILNERVRRYVKSLQRRDPVALHTLFPGADALAMELVGRMLAFDPAERISAEAALAHPFLEKYHDPEDEPSCAPPQFNIDDPEGTDLRLAVALELGKQQRMELGLLKNAGRAPLGMADAAAAVPSSAPSSAAESDSSSVKAAESSPVGEARKRPREEEDGAEESAAGAAGVAAAAGEATEDTKQEGGDGMDSKRRKVFPWATQEELLQRFRDKYQHGGGSLPHPAQRYADQITRMWAERREAERRPAPPPKPKTVVIDGVPYAPPPAKSGISAIAARAAAAAARRRLQSEAKAPAAASVFAGSLPPNHGPVLDVTMLSEARQPSAQSAELIDSIAQDLRRTVDSGAAGQPPVVEEAGVVGDAGGFPAVAVRASASTMSPLIPGIPHIDLEALIVDAGIDMNELQQDLELGLPRMSA